MTRRPQCRGGESGQVALYVVIMMTAAVGLVGIVVDAGAATRARSEAFGLASGAARAGAQQLDDDARTIGSVQLDPVTASQAAQSYLAAHDVVGQVEVSSDEIAVTVEQTIDYLFFEGGRTVSSTATVEPTQGPDQ